MQLISNKLIRPDSIEPRLYQATIVNTAVRKNTLCVLPTGLGKTQIGIMLAAHRLEAHPDSKIMIVAPTRPLCAQHQKSFQKTLNIPEEEIILLTGKISPEKRLVEYGKATVICATPQTIENDLDSGKLDLEKYSLLIVDEVHRAVKGYAYPFVVKKYFEQAKNPRVLGLTASPGSDEERIKEICETLGAEAVEIRTEHDDDVAQYVKQSNVEIVRVDLQDELKQAQQNLKLALNERLDRLKKLQIHVHRKTDLIQAQQRVQKRLLHEKHPTLFQQVSVIAETIKLWHALELLETQSVSATRKYFDKIISGDSKATQRMMQDEKVKSSIMAVKILSSRAEEHPKLEKMMEIIGKELKENPNLKIIIFSHYRDNIAELARKLKAVEGCRPTILIGQSGEFGLSQKDQIRIIKNYEDDIYNCLITSPIGEEGLHLASADLAVFYEPVASEIRMIQRRGRVARTKLGRIIILVTRGTKDERSLYSARYKESKMREILVGMQEEGLEKKGLERFM